MKYLNGIRLCLAKPCRVKKEFRASPYVIGGVRIEISGAEKRETTMRKAWVRLELPFSLLLLNSHHFHDFFHSVTFDSIDQF